MKGCLRTFLLATAGFQISDAIFSGELMSGMAKFGQDIPGHEMMGDMAKKFSEIRNREKDPNTLGQDAPGLTDVSIADFYEEVQEPINETSGKIHVVYFSGDTRESQAGDDMFAETCDTVGRLPGIQFFRLNCAENTDAWNLCRSFSKFQPNIAFFSRHFPEGEPWLGHAGSQAWIRAVQTLTLPPCHPDFPDDTCTPDEADFLEDAMDMSDIELEKEKDKLTFEFGALRRQVRESQEARLEMKEKHENVASTVKYAISKTEKTLQEEAWHWVLLKKLLKEDPDDGDAGSAKLEEYNEEVEALNKVMSR